MPKKGQVDIVLSERFIKMIKPIAKAEDRTVPNIIKLLIEESFGDKYETERANKILTTLREKYGQR